MKDSGFESRFRILSVARKHILEEVVIIAYLLVSVVSIRNLLAYGTIGHHWDWGIPPTSGGLIKMAESFFYLWNPNFLGQGGSVIGPLSIAIGALGFLGLNGSIVSKIIVVGTMSISGYGAFLLTRYFLNGKETSIRYTIIGAAFLSGYLYELSPFLYNDLIGGAITQFVTVAFAPFLFLIFAKTLDNFSYARLFLTAILVAMISISWQSLIIYSFLIVLYTLFFATRSKSISSVTILLKLAGISLLLNLYWLLSQLYTFTNLVSQSLGSYSAAGSILNLEIHTPTVVYALFGSGYWTNFAYASLPSWLVPYWWVVVALVMALVFCFLSTRKNSLFVFWTVVYILAILVATGLNSPIASFNQWFFVNPHNPIGLLFGGDPQRLVSPLPLAIASLCGLSLMYLFASVHRPKLQVAFFILLIGAVSIWSAPFFNGNLGNYVDNVQTPQWYTNASQLMNGSQGARVLFLPMSSSPLYLSTTYQNYGYQGADPLVDYSKLATIVTDAGSFASRNITYAITDLLYGNLSAFTPRPGANISLVYSESSGIVANISNAVDCSAASYINLYDLSGYIPGTSSGFYTFPLGVTSCTTHSGYSSIVLGNLSGVETGNSLQAALIAKSGAIITESNDAIYGIVLPHSTNYLSKLLSFFGIKYLLLRGDVTPEFGPLSPNGPNFISLPGESWSYAGEFNILKANYPEITLMENWGVASLWFNQNYRPNLVYAATKLFAIDNASIPSAINDFDLMTGTVLSSNFSLNDSAIVDSKQAVALSNESPARLANTNVDLTYTILNPTEIRINVQSSGPFILVYGATFDPHWEAFIGSVTTYQILTSNNSLQHFTVNGFSNGWLVNKVGNYTITLYYDSQTVAYIGESISMFTLVVFLTFLVTDVVKGTAIPDKLKLRNLHRFHEM